ncbi:helix-turn-helix transcriptional regulator [Limnohabitans sp. INBF002]|nr:helix-turn-helix transcriptional regulator [Limnohabitans sp. INBF002]
MRSALKEARKKAGLSQVQLAEQLYMEQSNLSKIERG